MSEAREETYLGDGLYASFDGRIVFLRAPRAVGGNHWVGLDPEVLMALLIYLKRLGIKVGPLDGRA
jgi:hypothetical protein